MNLIYQTIINIEHLLLILEITLFSDTKHNGSSLEIWVRFLSLFVHICPFMQTTKASTIGSLRIENIKLNLVRQEGFEPPTFGLEPQRSCSKLMWMSCGYGYKC